MKINRCLHRSAGRYFIRKQTSQKNTAFFSLLFLIVIPMLSLMVSVFAIIFYQYQTNSRFIRDYTTAEFTRMADACEGKLTTLSGVLSKAWYDSETATSGQNDNGISAHMTEEFQKISTFFPYIKNTYIYQYDSQQVYAGNGIWSARDFFTNHCVYHNYDFFYWKDFQFYRTESYRILSPTNLHFADADITVVPIVFRKMGSDGDPNYIVFNVDFKQLFDEHAASKMLAGVSKYVYNRYTNEIFPLGNAEPAPLMFAEDFLHTLSTTDKEFFSYRLDNRKCFISVFSPNTSFVGYTYFAVTPVKSINQKTFPAIWLSIAIALVSIGIALWLSVKNSTNIWRSIMCIGKAVSADDILAQKGNIIQVIMDIASKAEGVHSDISHILPQAQENYLVSLLNSTELYIDRHERQTIEESLNFPYDYFAVVIIQLSPTTLFFEEYNSAQYDMIKTGFYGIIKDIFSSDLVSYVLPGENNILNIILNLKSREDHAIIHEKIKTIYGYLHNDWEFMNLSIGVSEVHSDMKGLQKAHKEASATFYQYTENTPMVVYPTYANITFTSKDENDLFLVLSSRNSKMAHDLIHQILTANSALSAQETKCLYNYILNTILKVMRIKKIPYNNTSLDFEIINDCLNKPIHQAYQDMMAMVELVLNYSKDEKKCDRQTAEIIEYINENFTQHDLSLGFLADRFFMSQSKMSSLLSSQLDMGFHAYLSGLRINKAKDLIINTDKSIDEICDECGFSSRQTFFRIFKSTAGMTTTEYYNSHKS